VRKLIIALVSALALAVLPLASASAHGYYRPTPVTVYGTITKNGHPVNSSWVTVNCQGDYGWGKTNRRGQYDVTISGWQCKPGSHVVVTAGKNNESGMSRGIINRCHRLDLNVALVSVALPEFGLLTGIGAMVLGASIALLIRQRKLGANA
jgi:hypothetical protein